MPRNGSGTYSLPAGNPVVTGTTISSTTQNTTMTDVQNALTQSIASDGQTTPTANLPMGGFKHTGQGAGTATGDSVRWEQLFSQGAEQTLASAATTDIGAQNTSFLQITGTTTITSFGINYNGPRWLRFASALTITNSATLVCPDGADLSVAAGARAVARPILTGGWIVDRVDIAAGSVTTPKLADGNVTAVKLATGSVAVGAIRDALELSIRGFLAGFTMSTAGASATMTVGDGSATDSTNTYNLKLLASTAKTTAAWAVGSAVGGLDTGAIANNTWYHFYAIKRVDTGVVDVIFSLSATAPTLPANYTLYRRIGAGKTNGSAQWIKFIQDGDFFQWVAPPTDSTTLPSAATLRTLSVPSGVRVIARIAFQSTNSGGIVGQTRHWDPALAASVPFSFIGSIRAFVNSAVAQTDEGTLDVMTNTSAQIYNDGDSVNLSAYTLVTSAWFDPRGRNA